MFIPPIHIDPSRDLPLYLQVTRALIEEIQRGRLAPAMFLPSTRSLAEALKVNRKTIVLAYDELTAQGWLVSHGTRGTAVSPSLPEQPLVSAEHVFPRETGPVKAGYRFRPPPPEPLAIPTGPWRKIDEGAPDGRLFPAELLGRAYRSAVDSAFRMNRLQYRDPRGSRLLRESIANMLRNERGLMVSLDNVCITRGSQMGIFLATRILAQPGEAILFESLSYGPAVASAQACGAQAISVGLTPDGVDVDDVERACRRHRVRAIFLTPHHQFPTTVSLKPERRLRLLELARQFAFAVIEDDYDHEFRFGSQPLLPMASYAPDRVIYVGSLSKLLVPALRLGYVVATPEVIDAIAHEISLIDGMGNTLTEEAAADLTDSGEVRRHARKMTRIYAARRDNFATTVAEELGDQIDFRVPDGGLAFWLKFRDNSFLDRIERNAHKVDLRFASSHSFMTRPDAERGLRLGFASMDEGEARDAIKRLRRAGNMPA
ncbi:PLP-dependent aminotransferase family protein [Sphingobium boeckii]|uniref:GntR family transcriptional regulator/MocR family aminotransferase n=1 Tax=Sphingobium boeckii TaxID=1082345 RepID=A0A7W9EF30_9SPHN|nr:PLP-dependent aminotransferase family protein [Sphingobium boeckii]MBB5686883.1 GntR family transcriptional regulator/MocR family aminotransferase [Sphingobium boeckii]